MNFLSGFGPWIIESCISPCDDGHVLSLGRLGLADSGQQEAVKTTIAVKEINTYVAVTKRNSWNYENH